MKKLWWISFVLAFVLAACYKEEVIFDARPDDNLELPLILELNGKACFLDAENNRLRYSIETDSVLMFSPQVRFSNCAKVVFNNQKLKNNSPNNLGTIYTYRTYPLQITIQGQRYDFTLTFTALPLVRLISNSIIVDEPQNLARFILQVPDFTSKPVQKIIGLDYRGGVSQFNPKKSYGFSFLQRGNLGAKTSCSLLGWKKNKAWILDALYSDPSKVRNIVSFEIWKAMDATHPAIQGQLVELYYNNEYRGIYSLNEQMNAEQLELSSSGLLYKATDWGDGTTTFDKYTGAAPRAGRAWKGWEHKYPKKALNWELLRDLSAWVLNSSDVDFVNAVHQQIELDRMVDYYLFMNLAAASDNYGKNLFWTRKNSSTSLSIIPWDLDATWGNSWSNDPLEPNYLISNGLFDRLLALNPDNFRTRLKNRWTNLRAGAWSDSALHGYFDRALAPLLKSDVIELERMKWQQELNLYQERTDIQTWIDAHLVVLDAYVAGL